MFSFSLLGFFVLAGVAAQAGSINRAPSGGHAQDAATQPERLGSSRPLLVSDSLPLAFDSRGGVTLAEIPTTKALVDRFVFERAEPSLVQSESKDAAVGWIAGAGATLWRIGPSEARMLDRAGGREARTASLTSNQVRPDAIVASADRGSVWFFGDELYRYRMDSGELHRYRADGVGGIRRVLPSRAGIWIASERGVFLFDERGETFLAVPRPESIARGRFTHGAVAGDVVWLLGEDAGLVRVTALDSRRVDIAVSGPLPIGRIAETAMVDGKLWMLVSGDYGRSYRLAYVDRDATRLATAAGRFYSMRAIDRGLLVGAYEKIYAVDPAAKTITRLNPASVAAGAQSSRRSEISFAGSSYSIKDGSEVVRRYALDVSKAWTAPVWAPR